MSSIRKGNSLWSNQRNLTGTHGLWEFFSFFPYHSPSFSPSSLLSPLLLGVRGIDFKALCLLGLCHTPGAWFSLNIKRMNHFISGQQGDVNHSHTKARALSRSRLKTGWSLPGDQHISLLSNPNIQLYGGCYLHTDSFIPIEGWTFNNPYPVLQSSVHPR